MTRTLELFIDCDNVVYNLNEHVISVMNEELAMNYNYKDNKSWWWLDTGVNKRYFENLLLRDGIFKNGRPIFEAVKYINKLYEEGYKIVFISAPQWEGNMMIERVQWLKDAFYWFNPDINLVFTVNKSLCSNENRLLIDDSIGNLNSWNDFKICFSQPHNDNYDGEITDSWEELYRIINSLEEKINESI